DKIIKAAIMKYGLNNWSKVSSLLEGKSPDDCRNRWEIISPKNTKFTKEELINLLDTYKIFPNQWNIIAKCLKNKSAEQCHDAYNKIVNNDIDLIEIKDLNETDLKDKNILDNYSDDENKNEVIEFVTARLKNNKGRKEIKKDKKIPKNIRKLFK
ncbi:hypothetical protein H311_04311, partial [Anncaliia algerae PRA109]